MSEQLYVDAPAGDMSYPVVQKYVVPVEPTGTLTVTSDGVTEGDVYVGPDTRFGPEVYSDLPPGKYVIVEVDDE